MKRILKTALAVTPFAFALAMNPAARAQPALNELPLDERYVDAAYRIEPGFSNCAKGNCFSGTLNFGFARFELLVGSSSTPFHPSFDQAWFRQNKLELRFAKLSRDAKEIVAQVRYTAPALRTFDLLRAPSDSIEYQLRLKLKSCDGVDLAANANPQSLADRIASFYDRELWQNFFRCEMVVASEVADNDFLSSKFRDVVHRDFLSTRPPVDTPYPVWAQINYTPAERILGYAPRPYGWKDSRISFLGDNSIGVTFENSQVAGTLRATPRQNSGAAAKAKASVKDFIGRLYDYTDLLILTREKSAVERAAVVEAFMVQNREALKRGLRDYEANFAALTLMEKISAQWSIGVAYDYAKYFEREIARQPEVNLDRSLRSEAK